MSTIVDLEHTSQLARVLAFADARREQARREAAQIAMLTDAYEEVMDGPHGLDETAYASLYAVFAVEARMTDFQIGELMSIGHSLRQAFTLTGEAFTEGELSLAHVRAILEPAESIKNDPVLVPFYEAQIVEYAKTTTPGCARARAKQVVASLDPQTTQELHRAARETRTVRTVECENGMSELIVRGPTPLVNGAYDLLTRQAKGFEEFAADGDTRTFDNIRCDIAFDKLLSGTSTTLHGTGLEALKGQVNVTLSAKFLSGDAEGMAELDGYGALDPELAFELAGINPVWTKLFLDNTGEVVSTGSYSPTAQMRRTLRARDKTCRRVGCRRPATQCQIDHTHDWAKGGKTELGNLAHLCVRHHALKHPQVADEHRWYVEQIEPGVLKWTSPTGQTYIDRPEPRVMFTEAEPEASAGGVPRPRSGETWDEYNPRFLRAAREPANYPF